MGIYSLNRTGIASIHESEIVADERYDGVQGCYEQMIDMELNRQNIFETAIARDFLEASYVHEGRYDDVESLNEATVGSIFETIKAFLKKVWEKMKGIFTSFIKRLDSVVMRDNKKYVEKYQKEVRTKDLSKMKYKISKLKEAGVTQLYNSLIDGNLKAIAGGAVSSISDQDGGKNSQLFKNIKEKLSDGDYEDEVLTKLGFKNVEYKSFDKDIHELCFEDQEEEEGLNGTQLTYIIQLLLTKDQSNNVKKLQAATNKYFSNLILDVDKMVNQLVKAKTTDDDYENRETERTYAHASDRPEPNKKEGTDEYDPKDPNFFNAPNTRKFKMSSKTGQEVYVQNAGTVQQAIHTIEAVHNKLVGAYLKELKFDINQSRKIFAKAVSYNPKKHANESANLYLDAVEECAYYEAQALFEESFEITEL